MKQCSMGNSPFYPSSFRLHPWMWPGREADAPLRTPRSRAVTVPPGVSHAPISQRMREEGGRMKI